MSADNEAIPSVVVIALVIAAGVLPGAYGTVATVLLLALVALGTFGVYLRLTLRLGQRVGSAAVAVGVPAVFLVLEAAWGGWWQVPAIAVVLVYGWLAVEQVLIWLDGARPVGGERVLPPDIDRPCPSGKVKFASAHEAERAVSRSLQRHLDGTAEYDEPLRSSYRCDDCSWWHVTRQA